MNNDNVVALNATQSLETELTAAVHGYQDALKQCHLNEIERLVASGTSLEDADHAARAKMIRCIKSLS